MANSDKDIKITPNTNQTGYPEIKFAGSSSQPIYLNVLDDNTVSFSGSEGQVFSLNKNLTSGTIFSVNDISGLPSIDVDSSGNVNIAKYGSSVTLGSVISASMTITGTLFVNATISGATGQFTNLTASNAKIGSSTGVVISTSGLLSNVAPSTSGNVLTSNGTTWVSATSTGGSSVPTRYYNTSLPYTFGTNNESILIVSSSVTGTVTLPSVTTWAASKGQVIIKNISANSCSVAASGSDTIDAASTYTLNQNSSVALEWYLSGSTYNWIIV